MEPSFSGQKQSEQERAQTQQTKHGIATLAKSQKRIAYVGEHHQHSVDLQQTQLIE
jgi:hypothetical protein